MFLKPKKDNYYGTFCTSWQNISILLALSLSLLSPMKNGLESLSCSLMPSKSPSKVVNLPPRVPISAQKSSSGIAIEAVSLYEKNNTRGDLKLWDRHVKISIHGAASLIMIISIHRNKDKFICKMVYIK